MEATKTNQKEPPKSQKKPDGKTLNGTEQVSNWEKAAEMIAGNNQLMATLLKLLLSPLTLIAGAALIVYLFYKNKTQKTEIEKLKEENEKLTGEKMLLEEESENFRKKYKKLKKVFEVEQEQEQQQVLPNETQHTQHMHKVNKNKMSYLR